MKKMTNGMIFCVECMFFWMNGKRVVLKFGQNVY